MADYYDVLGVARDATQDQIKRAFRRLARDTHPDANPDDADAERRFREIAQAYEVLSDPQKRAAYDRGGAVDLGDLFSSFAGIDDLLGRFFGGAGGFGFGGARTGPAQGGDLAVGVEIDLAEAANGVTRTVDYRTAVACPTCDGSGSDPDVPLTTCERCSGQGSVRVTRQTLLGTTMSITTCEQCRGRGRVVVQPCSECRGDGSVVDDVEVTIDIPAGVEHGSRMRVPGRGAAGEAGGRAGDLYLEIRIAPDERYERHGADLVHRIAVGFAEATLGTKVAVPTVDGDPIDVDIPAGTQPGTVFKLSRMGMPRLRRRGRGDLLVEVQVDVPRALTREQEDALRAYAEAAGERPAAAKRRKRRRTS